MLLNCCVVEGSWVPWTARSNQSILKEISPEYSLERLMLKLQHFGRLTGRTDSLEKTLMLRKTEGWKRGWQRTRWPNGINSMESLSSGSWRWTRRLGVLQSTGLQSWTRLSNWTEWLNNLNSQTSLFLWLLELSVLCIYHDWLNLYVPACLEQFWLHLLS